MNYEFKYVKLTPGKQSVALYTGLGFHKGGETFYKAIIDNKPKLRKKDVVEVSVTHIEELTQKDAFNLGTEKDNVVSTLKNIVDPYIDYVVPRVTPVAVEQEVRYESVCGVPVMGIVDLLRRFTPEDSRVESYSAHTISDSETLVVCDYKVTGKKWPLSRLQNSIQFLIYTLATGITSVEIQNMTKSEKKARPLGTDTLHWSEPSQDVASNIRMLRHAYAPEEYIHLERIIELVAKQISAGIFPPCNPDSWWCSEAFCDYWHLCRGA